MRKDLLAYIALGTICIVWGTTYLAIRIAVEHFPPFLFVAIRQLIAGSLLLGFLLLTKKGQLPKGKALLHQAIAGFFLISMSHGLLAYAEVDVPSGVAAIIGALIPMMVVLVNLAVNREEKPNIPIFVGVTLGLMGILVVFGENIASFSNTDYLVGIILTFVASLCWAGGSVWIKKNNSFSGDPMINAGIQLFFGGVWLFPISFIFDDFSVLQWNSEVIYPLIYLIFIGSIVAFGCYSYALKHLPVTIVSLYAYINPIVAVVLGWLVLDEMLNAKIWIALFLIIGGIYIVNRGYHLRDAWRNLILGRR